MRFNLNIPNDFNSEDDTTTAIAECYDGDTAACENDKGQNLYDALSFAAKESGLKFMKSTDFGAIWEGTTAQFGKCVELLPSWAKNYASHRESRGGHRDGAGRKSTDTPRAVRWPIRWTTEEQGELILAAEILEQKPSDLIRDAAMVRVREINQVKEG